LNCTMWPPTIVAIVNQRSADGALQQHIYVCCRCVACLNLSDLLMLSENNRLVAQETTNNDTARRRRCVCVTQCVWEFW
jgi:hypothetical protein